MRHEWVDISRGWHALILTVTHLATRVQETGRYVIIVHG
jgi:hypothetical protein